MASGWKDKVLFTPGPLTTSRTVKQAMLRDLGSRDRAFIDVIVDVRSRLLQVAQADPVSYCTVLMQGSGTFAVEAVLGSTIPHHGRLLVVVNGAYGRRMVQMAEILQIDTVVAFFPENTPIEVAEIDAQLTSDTTITHVAVVHCETTTGIMNPVHELGQIVARHNRCYIVDAMSSFGAVSLDMAAAHIDYLISSSNKCIEGVPGSAFVLARTKVLLETGGYRRSLSLDLLSQYQGLEATGQFRFTPPTHALLAFQQALLELEHEGGVEGRAARYQENHSVLLAGMHRLGFQPYLAPEHQGYIITSFCYPASPRFNFERFYAHLNAHGYVIYPGKVSDADCFRIGHIGRITVADVQDLLAAIVATLEQMNIDLPVS